MAILRVEGLRKSFGGLTAVAGLGLEVEEGQIHSVIGPNGAGKTTLFHLISGYYPCDGGSVVFKGVDITSLSPQRIVRLGMGRSFQVTKIFAKLEVFENVQAAVLCAKGEGLNLFSRADRMAREATAEILDLVGLGDRSGDLAGLLAAGDRKRLELGIVLATSPDLLLLDEPTCGMSPVETAKTIELIQEISSRRSLSVLFTEHKMDVVFGISSRITVMNFGEVVAEGRPEEIRASERVRQIYFGEDRCTSR